MKTFKKISVKRAALVLLFLLGAALLYHLLILTGLIPFQYTWGGRLQNQDEMIVMESISLGINSFIMVLVAMRSGMIKAFINLMIMRILCLILCFIFILNTLGNLAATEHLEALIFTPVTFISAILFYRLWMKPDTDVQ